MKVFGIISALLAIAVAFCGVQTWRLGRAASEIKRLTTDLDVARATQLADRETYQQQIKLIREASNNADKARKTLSDKAGLSDADWLNSVLDSMWNKNTATSGATSTGMDAGAVQGAASSTGAATGKNAAAVQRGHDAQGN